MLLNVLTEYSGRFTLEDIKKVGLFHDYGTIDECLFEIFTGLDSSPSVSEKENIELIIKVPLNTRKYPEITFLLNMPKKMKLKNMKNYMKRC